MQSQPNRLIHEQSPYLLQHAHNPVDWRPWSDEAFDAARAEDKPIFLSIGYATCHWCHVMERESFENEEVAALLNDAFVCIKVDREERPDLDDIYMQVCQMMTRRGGWPLTIVMTPDRLPFYADTYIPREARFGRSGLMELVPQLSRVWKTRRADALDTAGQITQALSEMQVAGGVLNESLPDRAWRETLETVDPEYGGFGGAPKFPSTHRLVMLMRQNPDGAREMVLDALHAMACGGIWDHVGFGIHRYSTDRKWLVPHFEKMLYDQALLVLACVEAVEAYDDPAARRMAEQTLEYVLRDMTAPAGGFYSAEDADSEGEEGRFYVWALDELRGILSGEELSLVQKLSGMTEAGNFFDEATRQRTGANILYRSGGGDALSEGIRQKLFAVRERREHPLKDTKVLADWNGLMIAALAKAGRGIDVPEYTAAAERAAGFVLSEMSEDGRLWHRWRDGHTAVPGMLDDYAFMIFGLLELYETSFNVQWLEKAVSLNQVVVEHFRDPVAGGFYMTADDAESLIVRPKSVNDGALPAGNFMQMLNLLKLARLTGRTELEALAEKTGRAFGAHLDRAPHAFPQAMQAVQFAAGDALEVVIVGDPVRLETGELIRAVRSVYAPHKTVLQKAPGFGALGELAPFTKEMNLVDGAPAVYICRNFACEAPLTDPAAVRQVLAGA